MIDTDFEQFIFLAMKKMKSENTKNEMAQGKDKSKDLTNAFSEAAKKRVKKKAKKKK